LIARQPHLTSIGISFISIICFVYFAAIDNSRRHINILMPQFVQSFSRLLINKKEPPAVPIRSCDITSSASALQAFSLIDGLVRIAPEIVYEKERPRSELISTPDQILETARKLNENLSQITYKMVSKSLEFTPSTNL